LVISQSCTLVGRVLVERFEDEDVRDAEGLPAYQRRQRRA